MRKNGKTKRVAKNVVIMPAAVAGAGPATRRQGRAAAADIPGACQVLNLVLGPINLNLLGLVVRTNQINVRIDAVPGAGNLLGNLLCAVTNLLNPTGALGQLTGRDQPARRGAERDPGARPARAPATAAAAVAGR